MEDPNLLENEVNKKLYHLFIDNSEENANRNSLWKSPFLFGKKNLNGIKFIIINAFIACVKQEFPKIKPAITTKFVEMLNVIHLGLSLNAPIVLEGLIGQGKQTAIK